MASGGFGRFARSCTPIPTSTVHSPAAPPRFSGHSEFTTIVVDCAVSSLSPIEPSTMSSRPFGDGGGFDVPAERPCRSAPDRAPSACFPPTCSCDTRSTASVAQEASRWSKPAGRDDRVVSLGARPVQVAHVDVRREGAIARRHHRDDASREMAGAEQILCAARREARVGQQGDGALVTGAQVDLARMAMSPRPVAEPLDEARGLEHRVARRTGEEVRGRRPPKGMMRASLFPMSEVDTMGNAIPTSIRSVRP